MNFLDGYMAAGSHIRNRVARHEFYGSIIDYYIDGEIPAFKNEIAEVAFFGVKFSLDKARAGRIGGQANAKQTGKQNGSNPRSKTPSKRQANPEANGEANAKQTANESRTKEEEEEVKTEAKASAYQKDEAEAEAKAAINAAVADVIAHLNAKCGTTYRANSETSRKYIGARLADGATVEDCNKAIDNCVAKWRDDPEMSRFIRPTTIFGKEKFESYVNMQFSKQEQEGGENDERYAAYYDLF